jgi:hypothetical protein
MSIPCASDKLLTDLVIALQKKEAPFRLNNELAVSVAQACLEVLREKSGINEPAKN